MGIIPRLVGSTTIRSCNSSYCECNLILMKDLNGLNLEIERIHADIKLLEQSIDNLKNNHLAHMMKDIDRLNKILWAVCFGVFTQFIIVVRDMIVL